MLPEVVGRSIQHELSVRRSLIASATFLAVTATRAADLLTTYRFTPSLGQEANPVVAWFGAGRSVFLLTNFLGVGLFLLLPLFLYWRFPPAPVTPAPVTLREFITLQIYGRPLPLGEFLRAILIGIPLPRNWLQFLRMMGVVMSWTIAFGSGLAVLSWWATRQWHWQGYMEFRARFSLAGYPVMELLACIPVFYFVSWLYFRGERAAAHGDSLA